MKFIQVCREINLWVGLFLVMFSTYAWFSSPNYSKRSTFLKTGSLGLIVLIVGIAGKNWNKDSS